MQQASRRSGPRILIVRTSALGDIVHSLPVLTALRRHLPGATIGWVVEQAMAALLDRHPDLDRILPVGLRPWRHSLLSPTTLGAMRRQLGAVADFQPEIVLDLMGNHKAGALAALTLCDRRIGLRRSDRREPSSAIWISEPVAARGRHAVDRALSLLDAVGLPPEPADFGGDKLFPEPPAAAVSLLQGAPEFLVVHPGASRADKRYPGASWGAVARRMRAATGLATWVVFGPGEAELAREVEAAGDGAARAVSAPDLPILAALQRRARMVLAGDTGPLHLAHALGRPVLCLMGPTDPARSGPYGAPDRVLRQELPCTSCRRRLAKARACLHDLTAERVAERALALLTERSGADASDRSR